MKNLLKVATSYILATTSRLSLIRFNRNTISGLILIALTTALIGIACKKQEIDNPANQIQSTSTKARMQKLKPSLFLNTEDLTGIPSGNCSKHVPPRPDTAISPMR